MRIRSFFVALSLGLSSPVVQAQVNPVSVDVAGRPVKLVIPEGQCRLDPAQQFDGAVLNLATRAIAGTNEMLLHTAECKNLQAARTGKERYLNDFAQVQVSIQLKNNDFRGQETQSAREICNALRTQGAQIGKEVDTQIKDRIQSLSAGIAVNETRPLGVLGEDAHACYSGLLLNLRVEQNKTRLVLGVYAMTVQNGRLIYIYRFLAEPPDGSVGRLVEMQKKAVAAHVVLNNQPAAARK